jgi:hypothetical protein
MHAHPQTTKKDIIQKPVSLVVELWLLKWRHCQVRATRKTN